MLHPLCFIAMAPSLSIHFFLDHSHPCLIIDLGVYMDATLSFDEHIASVASSCLSSLSQINRIKHLLDRNIVIIIIVHLSGLVLPYPSTTMHLHSAFSMWIYSNALYNTFARLLSGSVHNLFLRIVCGFFNVKQLLRVVRF